MAVHLLSEKFQLFLKSNEVIQISNIRISVSLKENKWDGIDLNSDSFEHCVRKNKGKIL